MSRPARARRRREADRAVSAIVGFVLLFGILMTMLIAFQVTAVPAFNQGVEYEHNQRVQEQLDLLRTNLVVTATTGRETSSHLELGTDYPGRPLLLNPPPASGALRTGPPAAVGISGAAGTGEVGDYWTGAPRQFTTRDLTYTPSYNQYGNAPVTHLDTGVLFNSFDRGVITLSDESLVDGRRLSLLLVNGTLDRSGTDSYGVDIEPTSAPTRTVTVRNDTAPITLTVPTRLPERKWRELLADELVAQGGHVTSLTYQPATPYNRLTVALEPGVTYELALSRVGVGRRLDRPGAHYVTTVEPAERPLDAGRTTRLTVEVRDRFNSPVAGTTVDASVRSGGGSLVPVDPVTDTEGRATFRYTAPSTATTARIEARIASTPTPEQAATFTVEVFDPVSQQEFLDMGQRSSVVLDGVTNPTGKQTNTVEVDFSNVGSTDREIVAARFVSYYDSAPSSTPPDAMVLGSTGTLIPEGGATTTLGSPIPIPAGTTERVAFDFRDAAGGPAGAVSKADFALVSLRFADGTESTYLVQLTPK